MLTGECFCGEVRYRLDGDIHDSRSCHCSRCRKAFSGSGSAMGLVDGNDFSWTAGESMLSSYLNKEGLGYRFCRQCGSTLVIVNQDTVFGLPLGCLNEDPGISLGMHIFTGSRAGWDEIGGRAPQYETWPPESPE